MLEIGFSLVIYIRTKSMQNTSAYEEPRSSDNVCMYVCIYLWSLKLTAFMNEKSSACLIEWNDQIITIIINKNP